MPDALPKPVFSVITVVYNGAAVLERTLQSVVSQQYSRLEYLVIDGGSTDGTLELLERYRDRIDVLVSESDRGLYDAMNKGIDRASGDFIWFLNAGDEFTTPDTVARLAEAWQGEDVLYGETIMLDESGQEAGFRDYKRLPRALNWYSFREGMVVCHQSLVVSRRIAQRYNLDYPISADIDWAIRSLKRTEDSRIRRVDFPLSRYLRGGLSARRRRQAWRDRLRISLKHYGWVQTLVFHLIMAFKYLWRRLNNRPE